MFYTPSSYPILTPQPKVDFEMSNNMRTTTEATKAGKRKGTRSVSTLTPSQLARKRANDREAQRAIRARTKEHIESLEKEIEELRSQQNRDQTIQTLLQRNKTLEEELRRVKDGMGLRTADASEQYQHVFHNSSPLRSHAFGQSTPNYPIMQNIGYSNISDATEPWSATMPCSLPSTASSPSSSTATDDFGGGHYLATSAPSTAFEQSSMPRTTHSPTIPTLSCVSNEDFTCSQIGMLPMNPTYHLQPWNTYPMQHYQTPPTSLGNSHPMSRISRCQF